MPHCPNCKSRIPIWQKNNVFACPSCGVQLKTNGKGVHLLANIAAGFGALISLALPFAFSQTVQILMLLTGYIAAYFLVFVLFFEVDLESSSHDRSPK